ncbi:MAG: alpha/beta fold hydrolase [Oceanococcus sp.]
MASTCIRGLELHYHDIPASSGQGEVAVLLHGLGNSGQDWEFQWAALSAAGYRLICPDFIGFGQSATLTSQPAASKERLGPEPFAEDVWRLLQQLNIESCHLVGYSMGGAVAYQMAVQRPQAIRSLGIVCSVPCFVPQRLQDHWQFWLRHTLSRFMGMDAMAEKVVNGLFEGQPELIAKMRPRYANNDPAVYALLLSALSQWDVREQLSAIQCPVHVMAAARDYFRLSDVQESLSYLPQASLQVVPGASHGLPLQMPEVVNQALVELFSRSKSLCSASA